jgi:hypothetical protein
MVAARVWRLATRQTEFPTEEIGEPRAFPTFEPFSIMTMKQILILLPFPFILLFAISCKTVPLDSTSSQINHVVVCWLKQPGNPDARRQLIEASKTFQSIPGVVNVAAGGAIPSKRPQVDSTFDVAVVITFEDKQAMADYENHPTHKKAIQEFLIPLVKKFVIYDFSNDP